MNAAALRSGEASASRILRVVVGGVAGFLLCLVAPPFAALLAVLLWVAARAVGRSEPDRGRRVAALALGVVIGVGGYLALALLAGLGGDASSGSGTGAR